MSQSPGLSPRARAAGSRLWAGRRKWYWIVGSVPGLLAGASWYFTEPLLPPAPSVPPPTRAAAPAPASNDTTPATPDAPAPAPGRLGWGEERVEGDPAKQQLLDTLLIVQDRLARHDGYTATFRKQERLRGKLTAEQTIFSKVRREPFAVYFRFLKPSAGKEVVYAEGRHDGHMIAHETGLARRLLPRLKVAPDSSLALKDNRHPITNAGLFKLVDKLVGYRELDLDDALAETILDWHADDQGVRRPRSIHLHAEYRPERPFAYVEIRYDPETYLPQEFLGYDWPESRDTPIVPENLQLGERYVYEDVRFDVQFTELDFDPAHPDYEFTRF
jgi:hypothetical protein